MSVQTPEKASVAVILRAHLWSDTPASTCGCGWQAESRWIVDHSQPNRVEQWLDHVAAEVVTTLNISGASQGDGCA